MKKENQFNEEILDYEKVTRTRNFVAKHMNEFNRSETYTDKKNDYKRKQKYKKEILEY